MQAQKNRRMAGHYGDGMSVIRETRSGVELVGHYPEGFRVLRVALLQGDLLVRLEEQRTGNRFWTTLQTEGDQSGSSVLATTPIHPQPGHTL